MNSLHIMAPNNLKPSWGFDRVVWRLAISKVRNLLGIIYFSPKPYEFQNILVFLFSK
jgi:hypothetical protein